ncbi:MAG: MtnX-like HAD-IB family phosphatase [Candidatus Omnitrophica bacterium]|nr:MtnX-like HAD-IB family phosphatase [Candidatus Omnitrophota bacterium]
MPFVNRLHQMETKLHTKSPIVLSNCRVFFDFDHTMTISDVLDDVIRRFSINKNWMALEKAWLEGTIGTKECLEGQLKNVRVTRSALFNFIKKVELDPHFHQLLSLLVQEGIKPVILSDNFTCIIEKILEYHRIKDLKVYGNSLRFYRDHIIPSFPYDNPFCLTCAHCKKIHLTKDKTENKLIVFVGDGRSDFCPARVSDIVFAKDNLLRFMNKEELPCIPYKDLGDVYNYFQEAINSGRHSR